MCTTRVFSIYTRYATLNLSRTVVIITDVTAVLTLSLPGPNRLSYSPTSCFDQILFRADERHRLLVSSTFDQF